MKKYTTSERLKQIMNQRGLKQVDILNMALPYCEKYGVKLNRNDLSQYVNGKVEPGQQKLSILGLALNVSEAWLMGYEVPIIREVADPPVKEYQLTKNERRIINLFKQLDDIQQENIISKAELLVEQNEEMYRKEDIG